MNEKKMSKEEIVKKIEKFKKTIEGLDKSKDIRLIEQRKKVISELEGELKKL